ncbi:MAG TPA: SDR family oxidoreductase [Phototrophicaceae bacterium]|jgi:nucleoside-diphosphate-sugar epimerase|nr:SDR family oxidoreductase [Phototrophicaceae bacterium]
MKVFVTGASGFVGSVVVPELLAAGHEVVGLARSDASAAVIAAAGAEVLRGSLADLDTLRSGAAAADGVIHCAFIHDFSNYAASAEADRRAIETFGDVLAGSDRPLVVTAGIAGLTPGRLLTEDDASNPLTAVRFSESAGLLLSSRGVRVSVIRLPPSVHGEGDHGFVPALIAIARSKGVSAYPGEGSNRWASVHRLDAAQLYRLALESASAGSLLHAVGDEGVTSHEIAEVIGHHLNLPVISVPVDQAGEHFGWLGAFFALDMPASSKLTQQRFDWHPVQPGLIADLGQDHYFTQPESVNS